MRVLAAFRLFAANLCWRVTGARACGRTLVRGLSSPDENVRLIAGMLLVKGARRAAPLLREAMEAPSPLLLRVVADAGVTDLEPRIAALLESTDPELSRSAREALDTRRRERGTEK